MGVMRGAIIHAAGDVRYEDRPDPVIIAPTDAVIRTVAACVCGSDLWRYRGISPVAQPTAAIGDGVDIVWRESGWRELVGELRPDTLGGELQEMEMAS